MIEFLSMGFPLSVVIAIFFLCTGLILSALMIGFVSFFLGLILVYTGVIRILPIAKKIQEILYILWPRAREVKDLLKDIYTVKGTPPKERAIYMFHPHGSFSTSYFFHQMARLTSWPKEAYAKCTVTHHFFWLPFGEEILEALNAVPNRYKDMKTVLEGGESLAIIPGGVKEMNYVKDQRIIIHLLARKGIFRMALETGTPLVPVITYGENELYKPSQLAPIIFLNQTLEKWIGMQLCIPSWESVQKWIGIVTKGATRKVVTCIGEVLDVEKKENVSEEDIDGLKKRYIDALKNMYKKTKPTSYAKELIVV